MDANSAYATDRKLSSSTTGVAAHAFSAALCSFTASHWSRNAAKASAVAVMRTVEGKEVGHEERDRPCTGAHTTHRIPGARDCTAMSATLTTSEALGTISAAERWHCS